jgi:putative flippase GtrA
MNPENTVPAAETRLRRLTRQFSKFILVGGVNTGIDFAVFNALIFITGITQGYGLAVINLISFSIAVINSYFMNKYWTFQDITKNREETKFAQFIAVSLVGAGVNSGIVAAFTSVFPPAFGLSSHLWANAGKLLATGASLVWNFIGYKLFVFRR